MRGKLCNPFRFEISQFVQKPSGTFYYLCSVLDGYSRSSVDWGLRESMRETDIEVILERAKEKYPEAKPRIISDNGPQFIARDFKDLIRISGITHVRTLTLPEVGTGSAAASAPAPANRMEPKPTFAL